MSINDIKTKTITGVFWRLGERVLAQLVSFVVSVILARILFPEEYGVIALIMVFINIFNAFVTSGLGTALIQKKDADELDFSTMFLAGLGVSILLYCVIFFLSPFIGILYKSAEISLILKVMAIKLPISAVSSIQQAYVSKKMQYKKFFYSTLIGTIISGILGVAFALMGLGVWALVIQYLTNSMIDMIVLFITVSWRPKLEFRFDRFKSLFSYAYKVMLSGVIGTIFEQLKSFIIGLKYTKSDLAYYNRGEQIPSLIYNNVNVSLESVLFSTISYLQESKQNVKAALREMISCVSYIAMPMMFGIAVISRPLVTILLTEKWLPCVPFLVFVCISQCFGIIGNIHLQSIKALGKSDIVLKLELIKKPIFLLFIVIGMQYGPLQIIIFSCLYGFIALALNARPNNKILNYSVKEQLIDIVPSLSITIIMTAVCYCVSLLNVNVYIILSFQVLIGVIVYILLSLLFKIKPFYLICNFISPYFRKSLKQIIVKIFDSKLFRVKKNKIIFDNFNGKGYGCNPKYIAEEIIRRNLPYDMVWLVNNLNEEMPQQIRKVKKGSIKAFYELSTAKIWIDNVRNSKTINKKPNQYYIQTWHGSVGIKAVEKDAEQFLSKEYVNEAKKDGMITDLLLTNNLWQKEYMRKYFWYDGEIAAIGTPRCDIIYDTPNSVKEKVYSSFNLKKDSRIVLYAPTFRSDNNIDVYVFDYEKCCEILEKKFGGKYVMLIRLHPNISEYSNQIKYNKTVKNSTDYPDIQELISVSDVIITDYSSVGFEAALAYKPVFIYAPDLDKYVSSERKLLHSFNDIPFDVCKKEKEMYSSIKSFNQIIYKKKCDNFFTKIQVVHNPKSSKSVVDIIESKINCNSSKKN